MKELTHFEKIGVVTDETWIRGAVKAFGFLIPGMSNCLTMISWQKQKRGLQHRQRDY